MAKRRSSDDDDDFDDDAPFDDDEDDDDEDADDFDAIEWLTGDVDADAFELPQTWDDWIDFDWDTYEGEYEEYAVSADYE